jgi:hypothetical protein
MAQNDNGNGKHRKINFEPNKNIALRMEATHDLSATRWTTAALL